MRVKTHNTLTKSTLHMLMMVTSIVELIRISSLSESETTEYADLEKQSNSTKYTGSTQIREYLEDICS